MHESTRGLEGARQPEKTVAQDGFSAQVTTGATRRPWREGQRTKPTKEQQEESAAQQAQEHASASLPNSPARHDFATIGRRQAVEFADNGDGTLTAVRCLDASVDDLDIQQEAGSWSVTAIAPRAFEGTALCRVTLPDSLRQIGEMAFSGCTRLSEIVIPACVHRVGTLAFAKCSSLQRVRIEPGVAVLGPSCFSKCIRLRRVDIPNSVTSFGGGVFFGCGGQLTLFGAQGSSAERYAALNGLSFDSESWRADETLVLREEEDGTLTVLGAREKNPVRIDIPSELCGRRIARIAPKAFFASNTLEMLSVGAGISEIGQSAFFGCRSLAQVLFVSGVEHIGESAFAGCESLTQITLPQGTDLIERMAFFGCSRLLFVRLPANTRVADLAFDGCAPNLRIFGGVYVGRAAPDKRFGSVESPS